MPVREVDAYLAKLSGDKRATLEKVRRAIRAAAPHADEAMSYGMPAFIQGKPIAGYSASANHCSYFPMSGSVTETLETELRAYETSKGGFRFPIGQPPRATLIRKLVKARLAEVEAASGTSKAGKKPARAGAVPDVASVLRELEKNASKAYRADMSGRYGIVTKAPVYGTPVAKLRRIAKTVGVQDELAEALWRTGIHDARMLATMVADPRQVTAARMDRWAKDFDNWALVDTACFTLFDRTAHAFKQIEKWAGAQDEFVKRAAFALLASCALHGFGTEKEHLRGLGLIERAASDPRNFVKKGVSWALRAIAGKKNRKLYAAARALAERLSVSDDPTQRWIGKDALRAFAKAKPPNHVNA
jgi:3-methyladenine DNA glycosylase AlkD/uncharacterized protein YdhG (YjbR/CyaY superfamily)